MPAPPPTSPLPFYFSALRGIEPGSHLFLQTLDAFLGSREEREQLEQLERSAAFDAADVLDEVRDQEFDPRKAQACPCVACGCAGASPPFRTPQTHSSYPTVALWDVGGVTYLLLDPGSGKIVGWRAPICPCFALRRGISGAVGRGNRSRQSPLSISVRRRQPAVQGRHRISPPCPPGS